MLAGVGVSAVSTHETEIYAGERTGDTSREEHPSATPRHFSAEDKIRIVLEGLRGDDSIAELCRREVSEIRGSCRGLSAGPRR